MMIQLVQSIFSYTRVLDTLTIIISYDNDSNDSKISMEQYQFISSHSFIDDMLFTLWRMHMQSIKRVGLHSSRSTLLYSMQTEQSYNEKPSQEQRREWER